jgi:hypothetical protein
MDMDLDTMFLQQAPALPSETSSMSKQTVAFI